MSVDHVYTWVNTQDEDFLNERARLAEIEVRDHHAYRSGAARIADNGEMRASLASARRFLPFIRRTIIFGAGVRPAWLDAYPHVEYVEQASVIPKPVWPTYQSDVVEAYIHRIPGLSERYIYSNDDMFFSAPHRETDFFDDAGRAKVSVAHYFFGSSPTPVYHRMEVNSITALKRIGARYPVERRRPGPFGKVLPRLRWNMFRRNLVVASAIAHVSQPFLKSGWLDFWATFGDELNALQQKRFRTMDGFAINAMYQYLAYTRGRAVMRYEPSHFLLKRDAIDMRPILLERLSPPKPSVTRFCLNDGPVSGEDGWNDYLDRLYETLSLPS